MKQMATLGLASPLLRLTKKARNAYFKEKTKSPPFSLKILFPEEHTTLLM